MRVLIYSFKGGTGKTSLALNLHLTLDYGVITNDQYSPVDKVVSPKRLMILKEGQGIPFEALDKAQADIIYDFGGYVDKRVVSAMEDADVVVIPTTNSFSEIQVARATAVEAEKYNAKIIFVANKAGKGDLDQVSKALGQWFSYPVLPLKNTRALARIYSAKKSLRDWKASTPLNKFVYGDAADQFEAIIAAIEAAAAKPKAKSKSK